MEAFIPPCLNLYSGLVWIEASTLEAVPVVLFQAGQDVVSGLLPFSPAGLCGVSCGRDIINAVQDSTGNFLTLSVLHS